MKTKHHSPSEPILPAAEEARGRWHRIAVTEGGVKNSNRYQPPHPYPSPKIGEGFTPLCMNQIPHMKTPKPPAPPKLSDAPWLGYTSREHLRDRPLRSCSSPRCKRVKSCVAAHDDLYCQRTHWSHAQYLKMQPPNPDFIESTDLEFRREQMLAIIEKRMAKQREKINLWKAGAFDDLYGKYKRYGVLKYPPEKRFVE
jgi:hypothetical protein